MCPHRAIGSATVGATRLLRGATSFTRAASYKRLAISIQERNGDAVEQDAGLIAKHFEAAGELAEAYSWYMRAATWLHQRDVGAARDCWQRARTIADRLSVQEGDTDRRIAPRAQLSISARGWSVGTMTKRTALTNCAR